MSIEKRTKNNLLSVRTLTANRLIPYRKSGFMMNLFYWYSSFPKKIQTVSKFISHNVKIMSIFRQIIKYIRYNGWCSLLNSTEKPILHLIFCMFDLIFSILHLIFCILHLKFSILHLIFCILHLIFCMFAYIFYMIANIFCFRNVIFCMIAGIF